MGELQSAATVSEPRLDQQLAAAPSRFSAAPSTAVPAVPAASFRHFAALPTELRLKIWHMSFLPRVVEIHRRKAHYADDSTAYYDVASASGGVLAKWQSLSANPEALAVCFEARSAALGHYTATIRLAVNTPCERAGEARLGIHRRLYLAPHHDTLAVLGDYNMTHTVHLLRHIEQQDPYGAGLERLALCASSFNHLNIGISMAFYSRTVFQHLGQLTLFMYDEPMPPKDWKDGHCDLADCRETYPYRRFEVGHGGGLKLSNGQGWMTVGNSPLQVMELVFGNS